MSDERERLRAQLREHADRRRDGLATAREELDAIAQLLPRALDLGIKKVELAELTGLSRPTINALLKGRS
jgi:CRP-like cAMP-binding protein